jgi:predicted TIM-barrel fold metal-dependent hydrolase
MWQGEKVIDADSHVMEPGWLWQQYIEPGFRDNCLRVHRDPADGDKLLIAGKPSRLIRRLGGVRPDPGHSPPDWNSLQLDSYLSYDDSCTPASWDPAARLRWLDQANIDSTFLFPSLGLIWPRESDPRSSYTAAHLRAYNRWLADFAAAAPGRLIPVAQLALTEGESVAAATAAVARAGFGHVMLPLGAARVADLDEFFAAAQEHGLAVHLHKVAIPHLLPLPGATTMSTPHAGRLFTHALEILPGQLFLTALIDAAVPDRFPELRFAFHECNAGWLPSWIDRLTESYQTLAGGGTPLPESEPDSYLRQRDMFFFSIGLGEDVGQMPEWLFTRLLLATDYPHPGFPPDPEAEWALSLRKLPTSHARALTGRNAYRLLNREGS